MCIRLEQVNKAFGKEQILQQFSLELQKNQVTALLGPSGCGKTTILRLLCGLEKPDGGRVQGAEGGQAVLFQENRLLEYDTVRENWALVTNDKECMEKTAKQLALTSLLDMPAGQLSGGEKRRAALGRALCFPAEALLLDEPFTGVDVVQKEQLLPLLRRQFQGKTVLLITHEVSEAIALADQVVLVAKRPLQQMASFSLKQPLLAEEQEQVKQRITRKMECDF